MARLTAISCAILALTAASCGGKGATPHDAGPAGSDGATADRVDAKAGNGGAGTTGGAGIGGIAGQDGGAGAGTGVDGGVSMQIRKLVTGPVALIGSGTDTCTNLAGSTADRWCAFLRQSALTGAIELWVVDVTSLVAGGPLVCDGTSPGCVRLSATAVFDPDFGAGVHHFYGDTLIYFADAGQSATGGFEGLVWAWRPGWAAGRKLTSTKGNDCIASAKGDAIACFQASAELVTGELSVELVAGRAPVADNMPLPSLERMVLVAAADAQGVQKFEVAFSDDGAYVGWSGRTSAAAPETLKVQKIDDAASRQTIASDISRWEITQDGKSWLWLRGYNHSPTAPSGTLERAPFPAGTPPVTLATGVSSYHGFSSGSILFQTTVGAEMRRMPDRGVPATTQLLDQDIAAVFDFSDDGSTVVYAKTFDPTGLNDMFVRNVDAPAPCPVTAQATAVATATLFAKAGTVLWARLDPVAGVLQGSATSVATCKTTTFASNVLRWLPAGDEGLTVLDDTAATADDSTLRYSALSNGVLPARGTPLQTHIAGVYAPLAPVLPAVLYTGATTATAGLYVYVGPPLPSTAAAAGDAGVTEGGADAAPEAGDGGAADADAGVGSADGSDAADAAPDDAAAGN